MLPRTVSSKTKVDWLTRATWRVRSIEDGANRFDSTNPRPTEAADVGGTLQIGSFNVLNYFRTFNTIFEPTNGPDDPADNTAINLDPRGANSADEFARRELGRDKKVGLIDEDRINVMGGSIAIGHPFGATGARVTLTLLNEMKRRGAGVGLISVCAAGALGFAMVVERT